MVKQPRRGGKGSLHFVERYEMPGVTSILQEIGLPRPFVVNYRDVMKNSGHCTCSHSVDDWSYYENEGLEVMMMHTNAEWFQGHLKEINTNLSHPEEWVRVIDDTKGNSDHYNFIMHNHTATWLRGQHQYIHEEGDTCEQTPKHSQADSVATVNQLAGGRTNVEAGLQTGLDIIATMAWWDWNATTNGVVEGDGESSVQGTGEISIIFFLPWFIGLLCLVGFITVRRDEFQLGVIIEEDEETDYKPESNIISN